MHAMLPVNFPEIYLETCYSLVTFILEFSAQFHFKNMPLKYFSIVVKHSVLRFLTSTVKYAKSAKGFETALIISKNIKFI